MLQRIQTLSDRLYSEGYARFQIRKMMKDIIREKSLEECNSEELKSLLTHFEWQLEFAQKCKKGR